ncbi:hypothetical protein D3C78_1799050 [compost metagenome]
MASGKGLIYFAALWEAYPVGDHTYYSVAMVTRASADMRRPVILDEEGQALWLAPDSPQFRLLELFARPQVQLREAALATFVNDPACDGPECLTPA